MHLLQYEHEDDDDDGGGDACEQVNCSK